MSVLDQASFGGDLLTTACSTVGRPIVYGSVLGGQAGVEQVIKHTLADLDTSLGLAGYKSLSEIQGKADVVLTKLNLD